MTQAKKPAHITIFGHRGARGVLPENSMVGARYLRQIGIEAIEIDVRNAAGRVPVLVHDPYISDALARDRDGAWIRAKSRPVIQTEITELLSFDIGELRIGSDYAAKYPDQMAAAGERIPTFAEFCKWAATEPSLLLNIEIKSNPHYPALDDLPEILAADVIQQLDEFGLRERAILSSFDWRVIHACARQAPDIKRGYLTSLHHHGGRMVPNISDGSPWMDGALLSNHKGSLPQTIADLHGQVWSPFFKDITQGDLARAHELGLLVNVWTVNEPDDIHRMAEMGVDGIISDYPALVQKLLFERK